MTQQRDYEDEHLPVSMERGTRVDTSENACTRASQCAGNDVNVYAHEHVHANEHTFAPAQKTQKLSLIHI